ncbi:uncharacterized protein CDAR_224281 [Caerostris darwini]|uniref:Uncharacterized protein n=1 Tax=Caerostris darwini TaxID=1538125 RepID=A0AAV4Q6A4_9ARAC|nr:uncharacterized protein CDAR_224281 [Caerostris darwini]
MLLVNHAVFILAYHYVFKITYGMEDDPNLVNKQSDPYNFIAVRDTVEEDIVDLQPIMQEKNYNLEGNFNRFTKRHLRKEHTKPKSLNINKPQENFEDFPEMERKKYARRNQLDQLDDDTDKNLMFENVKNSAAHNSRESPVQNSRLNNLNMKENILHNPRIYFRIKKKLDPRGMSQNIRYLQNNKRSSLLKRSDDVIEQSNAYDGLSFHNPATKRYFHQGVKLPRSANYLLSNISSILNNQLSELPRDPFSESIAYHRSYVDSPVRNLTHFSKMKPTNATGKTDASKDFKTPKGYVTNYPNLTISSEEHTTSRKFETTTSKSPKTLLNFVQSSTEKSTSSTVPTTITEALTTAKKLITTTEILTTATEALTTAKKLITSTEMLTTTTQELKTATAALTTAKKLITTTEMLTTTEELKTATEELTTATEGLTTVTEELKTATEELTTTTEGLTTATEALTTTMQKIPTTIKINVKDLSTEYPPIVMNVNKTPIPLFPPSESIIITSTNKQLSTSTSTMFSSTEIKKLSTGKPKENLNSSHELLQRVIKEETSDIPEMGDLNFDYSTPVSFPDNSNINYTTDDVIQIQLFGDFGAYAISPREKKALVNQIKKGLFEDWKRMDFVLIGIAGFTAFVLVTSCIAYGQFKKRKFREKHCKDLDVKQRTQGGVIKFIRSMHKTKRNITKKERYDSLDKESNAIYTGRANEATILNESCRPLTKNILQKHSENKTSQKRSVPFKPELTSSEIADLISHRETPENFARKSSSCGSIVSEAPKISAEERIRHPFNINNDAEGMRVERHSKSHLRYSLSETSVKKYSKEISEPESNDISHQVLLVSGGELVHLPSLPSISSDNTTSSSQGSGST